MKQLFDTKRTTLEDFSANGLERCLGAFDLTLLRIGAIICGRLFGVRDLLLFHAPQQVSHQRTGVNEERCDLLA
ncbi:MAG: hypothetical protein ACREYE_32320 [Gammaproteobacteria bacterium]